MNTDHETTPVSEAPGVSAPEVNAPAPETGKRRTSRPFITYLVVMTGVVMALLLLSYVMQQRTSQHLESLQASMADIQNSYELMDTINDLEAQLDTKASENETLSEQVNKLTEETKTLSEENANLDSVNSALTLQLRAMEYLNALECAETPEEKRAIADTMEKEDLPEYLSDSAVEGTSPKTHYEAIMAELEAAESTASPTPAQN